MTVTERFLDYVAYDTQSDGKSNTVPSSEKQLALGKHLVEELHALGIENAHLDEYGIVYAWLEGNVEGVETIGWIAHMDTASEMSGKNVKARVVRDYDGKDILLNEKEQIVMKTSEFPFLKEYVNEDLIVTDGTTLLGGDDKAGIAIIMEALDYLVHHPSVLHGRIAIAFTPDEEIGRGTDHFDIQKFGAKFAYTVDGGPIQTISYETFHAASALVEIHGSSIHPGSAKGKMINAALVAMELHQLLPALETPAATDGYEGFFHLCELHGAVEEARMEYIIRDHDREKFERKKALMAAAVGFINTKYGTDCAVLTMEDSYYNMREKIEEDMSCVDLLEKAYASLGIAFEVEAIRGGTDGARLTYEGLPCPNIGTGDHNCHGKYEFVVVSQMETGVKLLVEMAKLQTE
ncbi:MAG TPA: peptidase T [Candidatus Onthosoma merdavium]|uniref:Peptidase T n=3 Tax=Massilicoli timonensis TaxID=2015901 RepID=A0ABT1SMZ1_9FIRM|nr:peptidase T [Massilicoli timonensis]MCQ5122574.1 peptidase T [Massilicoli timonensis]HIR15493.1 peptidase T [Candidatus Onthosoma merdavium]